MGANEGPRTVALNWLKQFMTAAAEIPNINAQSYISMICDCLHVALFASETEQCAGLRLMAAELWVILLESLSSRLSSNLAPKILSYMTARLFDVDKRVRRAYLLALNRVDPYDTICALDDPLLQQVTYVTRFKKSIRMAPNENFGTRHLGLVLYYIGIGSAMNTAPDPSFESVKPGAHMEDWLSALFHSCGGGANCKKTGAQYEALAANISLEAMLSWAVWQTAHYLIISKLRTPIGGPLQTLEALGQTLESFMHELSHSSGELRNFDVLQRLNCLLMVIDALEVQICSCATGSFQRHTQPPKLVILFFNANYQICQDWFSKIRSNLICAARLVENDGLIMRYSCESLADTEPVKFDSIAPLYSTLMQTRDCDNLEGLAEYCKRQDLDSPLSGLLWASAKMAAGNLEFAVEDFQKIIPKSTVESLKVELLSKTIECYVHLNDYKAASEVFSQMPANHRGTDKFQTMLSSWGGSKDYSDKELQISFDKAVKLGISESVKAVGFVALRASKFDKVAWHDVEALSTIQLQNSMASKTERYVLIQSAAQLRWSRNSEGLYADVGLTSRLMDISYLLTAPNFPKLKRDALRKAMLNCARKSCNYKFAGKLLNVPSDPDPVGSAMDRAKLVRKHDHSKACALLSDLFTSNSLDNTTKSKICRLLVKWNSDIDSVRLPIGAHRPLPEAPGTTESGRILRHCVELDPASSKGWLCWASYSFERGSGILNEFQKNRMRSTKFADECSMIAKVLGGNEVCCNLLVNYILTFFSENYEGEVMDKLWYSEANLDSQSVSMICSIVESMKSKILSCFRDATNSYFKYLELYSDSHPVYFV
jgi:Serine/threonine-protein kinase smg-1